MGRMVRKQVYIDDRQERLLKEHAAASGRTESELIRRAIDALLDADYARQRRIRAVEDALAIGERMSGVAEALGHTGPAWPGRAALYEPPRGMPK